MLAWVDFRRATAQRCFHPPHPALFTAKGSSDTRKFTVCVCVFLCAYDAYFMSSAQLIPAPADKGLNKAFAYLGDLVFGFRCMHVTASCSSVRGYT